MDKHDDDSKPTSVLREILRTAVNYDTLDETDYDDLAKLPTKVLREALDNGDLLTERTREWVEEILSER